MLSSAGMKGLEWAVYAVSYRRKGIVFSSSPKDNTLDVDASSLEIGVGEEDDIVNDSRREKGFSQMMMIKFVMACQGAERLQHNGIYGHEYRITLQMAQAN
jgi:hypothetical protein